MIDGGAGRAIAAIPALIKYAKKNDDFAVMVHGWDTLYWGIPELQDKTFNPEQKGIFEQVVLKAEEIISPEPYRVPGYFKQEKSLAEAFDYLINNTDDHSDLGVPVLKTSKMEEINAAGMVLEAKNTQQKQRTIVVQPFGRSAQRHQQTNTIVDESSRSLDPQSYLKLVKKLGTKYNLVLMAEQPMFMEEDTYTLKPQADLRSWVGFMGAVDYFVGVDSVGQHMARALNIPGTVIVGSTFAINTTYPDYFNIIEKKDAKKYSPIRISGLESHLADRANDTLMDFDDDEINKIYSNIIKDIEKKVK